MAFAQNDADEAKKAEKSDLPIIAVLGATGAQGGAVLRALTMSGLYAVRGLTRDPNSDKAKAIIKENQNTTMVKADSSDVESLKKALDGADGVFSVTFYWNHYDPAKEQQEIRNICEAAKACNVKHVVHSTMEDTRILISANGKSDAYPTLAGKYKVPPFDCKAEANKVFQDAGVPTTFVLSAFYWQNFVYLGMGPQATDKPDEYSIVAPMKGKLVGMNLSTFGIVALCIFRKGADEMKGKYVGVADDAISYQEMCERMSKKCGKRIQCQFVEPSVYAQFGFPGAAIIASMFRYYDDFGDEFLKAREYEKLKKLCGGQLPHEANGFDVFLQEMSYKIPFPEKK